MQSSVIEFISKNSEKILRYTTIAYKHIDAKLQTQLKSAYTDYLSNIKEKYSKSKSFFIRNQPTDLYEYYVPTSIKCDSKSFQKAHFLPVAKHNKKIIITGSGGCGKSILMRHLLLDCINNAAYVPIFIDLRDINSSDLDLENSLIYSLNNHGFKTTKEYLDYTLKDGHFCFFLDGLDEIASDKRSDVVKSILFISNKYKKCPIILSSRPDDIFSKFEEFSIFHIQPLSLSSAVELIKKLPFDLTIKGKFIEDLQINLFTTHQSFLSNPLLLSIMLMTYSEHAEIPSKLSIFYNQAYEVLFQRHDAQKGAYVRTRKTSLDMQDFSKVFALFSLQTYDKRIFSSPRSTTLDLIKKSLFKLNFNEIPEDYLEDLLKSACLMIEDGLDIAYSHRSFQEYFVAKYISESPPEIQDKLLNRYVKTIGRDNVFDILLEINPVPVERYLVIPILTEYFRKIGVKKTITKNISVKILKHIYKSISISKEGISAILNDEHILIMRMMRVTNKITSNYKYPSGTEYLSYKNKLLEKFKINGETEFEIKNDCAFIQEVLNLKGVFSIGYFQSVFDSLNEIKVKNSNSENEIDELLSI